ncbi:hypothetical protein RHGRI_014634 [Rhododendron griersonianum]|uniref:Uncharacterized protein n=1 Tax=Rhododendron griersonianum TaxID=479676 RepID=A0AAV6KAK2_9ERIC|nr:hypothetical protein RHGRI_014634 [Rhododendron griersonianum]
MITCHRSSLISNHLDIILENIRPWVQHSIMELLCHLVMHSALNFHVVFDKGALPESGSVMKHLARWIWALYRLDDAKGNRDLSPSFPKLSECSNFVEEMLGDTWFNRDPDKGMMKALAEGGQRLYIEGYVPYQRCVLVPSSQLPNIYLLKLLIVQIVQKFILSDEFCCSNVFFYKPGCCCRVFKIHGALEICVFACLSSCECVSVRETDFKEL